MDGEGRKGHLGITIMMKGIGTLYDSVLYVLLLI